MFTIKKYYLSNMVDIVILGAGNVSLHLCKAFSTLEKIAIKQVYSRSRRSLEQIPVTIDTTTNISELKNAPLYIIAVPDDAIKGLSEDIPFSDKLVVHTSGCVSMDELSDKNRKGVFYPLQTFSKNRNLNFKEVPICIESGTNEDLDLLMEIGNNISDHVEVIDSEKRAKLHLAAVFVNNFVNHLYKIGQNLLEKDSLSFDLLKPLIKETSSKVMQIEPEEAQTGPAMRNDLKTIENHLNLLNNNTNKEIYQLLSKTIKQTYGKEL